MKKQTKVAALAVAAVLGSSALAIAAPAQLSIYGASAQGDFWVSEANPFLISLGCKASDRTSALPSSDDANAKILVGGSTIKFGFAKGFSCTSTLVPIDSATGQRDLEIRSAGIASLEGPLAVKKLSPIEPAADKNGACAAGSRLMLKDGTNLTSANLDCYPIHVGTTDLSVENINQSAMDENWVNYYMPDPPITATGLGDDRAIIVPFTFAINKNVKARHCKTPAGAKISGSYCTADAQCGQTYDTTTNTFGNNTCDTASTTIDTLSRTQAVQLFSGQVANWQDLGAAFDSQAVSACIRKPGSGTHAAIEKTVMNAGDTGWGNLIAGQNNPPAVNYIGSSDDMVNCINTNTGGVGYLDADKGLSAGTNVVKVNYNGNFPSRANIRNGAYDFYTVGHMYTNPTTVTGDTANLYGKLRDFAQDPKNIPGTTVASGTGTAADPYVFNIAAGKKAIWWAALKEMKFIRDTDLKFPALNPQGIVVLP